MRDLIEITDLRDWFAGMALSRMANNYPAIPQNGNGAIAKECYGLADAMLKERKITYVAVKKEADDY